MPKQRKKVLVTGGQGFLGSHLTMRLLSDGHDLVVIDSPGQGRRRHLVLASAAGAVCHTVELSDPSLRTLLDKERPDVVVHLIERSDARRSLDDPLGDAGTNLIGTLNLLEACRYAGVQKFVMTTSALRLFGGTAAVPVVESFEAPPDTPCGVARRAAIEYLHLYHDRFGLDWLVLALGNVYGPGQRAAGDEAYAATFLTEMIESRVATVHGDGSQTRDFVYIDDVARAVSMSLTRGSRTVLNVGTGVETPLWRLYDECRRVTGFTSRPNYALERQDEVWRFALDPSRARLELGFEAVTPLERGIELTYGAMSAIGGARVAMPA